MSGTSARCEVGERRAAVSPSVELCYEQLGDRDDPLVLLVMGLGLDLCWWREDFFAQLPGRGLRAVRFDNRDVGRSTHFVGPGVSATQLLRRRAQRAYSLEAMADDAAGLIERLAPARGAHVVGVSMGAFVAQELAIRHPDRVDSLVSIMGRPGDGRSGRVSLRMVPEFLRPAPADPDRLAEHLVRSFGRIGSEHRTERDDDDVRVATRRLLAREEGDGSGGGRQLAAILSERDRTADLGGLQMPAAVVHGLRDRVVQPSGGRATAAAIPRAELLEIPGMGHDLPRWTWPHVLDAISATVARAGSG
ncbi:MAG: alpha/beta fold hydrolase [Solirubrobacteraceae bacterium]